MGSQQPFEWSACCRYCQGHFNISVHNSLSGLPDAGIASSEESDTENCVLVAGNWRRRTDQHPIHLHSPVSMVMISRSHRVYDKARKWVMDIIINRLGSELIAVQRHHSGLPLSVRHVWLAGIDGKCNSRRGQSTHKLKGHEITWECERWIRASWLCVLTVQNYVSALDLHNDPKLASLSELMLIALTSSVV
ncbi:unnamed protein product [Prunus armeniaca]|uniref:Uncharacterized protein n=1 Tax=Prunus armeniaca TaxID=36596 RepID=A0A6J5XV67_PRUAR|nr:unnamed protein product [Prunus armeniaca]